MPNTVLGSTTHKDFRGSVGVLSPYASSKERTVGLSTEGKFVLLRHAQKYEIDLNCNGSERRIFK